MQSQKFRKIAHTLTYLIILLSSAAQGKQKRFGKLKYKYVVNI